MTSTRIDKWLWAVRFCKTRTLATTLAKSGKIKVNEAKVKASSIVKIGDEIRLTTKEHIYHLKVLGILDKRVGAPIAQQQYEHLSDPIALTKDPATWGTFEKRDRGTGRPTKKDRRDIDRLKNE